MYQAKNLQVTGLNAAGTLIALIISYHSVMEDLIFTGSLDNAVMHSGKEMGWAILDETKDSREEDVKEIILTRLRQPGMYLVDGVVTDRGSVDQQWNPMYVSTSPAKTPWITEWFELEKYIDEISSKIYSDKTFFEKEFDGKKAVYQFYIS